MTFESENEKPFRCLNGFLFILIGVSPDRQIGFETDEYSAGIHWPEQSRPLIGENFSNGDFACGAPIYRWIAAGQRTAPYYDLGLSSFRCPAACGRGGRVSYFASCKKTNFFFFSMHKNRFRHELVGKEETTKHPSMPLLLPMLLENKLFYGWFDEIYMKSADWKILTVGIRCGGKAIRGKCFDKQRMRGKHNRPFHQTVWIFSGGNFTGQRRDDTAGFRSGNQDRGESWFPESSKEKDQKNFFFCIKRLFFTNQ